MPNFSKSTQKSLLIEKNAKIALTKPKFKVQHITFETLKYLHNKPSFEHAYLGKNVLDLLKQKIAQNVTITLGLLHLFKKS